MKLFSSPIGRLAFLGRYILVLAVIAIGKVLLSSALENQNQTLKIILSSASIVFELSGLYYLLKYIMFARLLSIGLSKWYTLILLIPLINLIFLLILLFCPEGQFVKKGKAD